MVGLMFPTNAHAHIHTHKQRDEIEEKYSFMLSNKRCKCALAWNGGGDS